MIGILIITHGKFGEEMINSAQSIIGEQQNVKTLQLPSEEALEMLNTKLQNMLIDLDKGNGVIILTDMLGGTPCNICLPYTKTHKVEIVSGVNLYMILTACLYRDKLSITELVEKIVEAGRKNIADIKQIFLKKLK